MSEKALEVPFTITLEPFANSWMARTVTPLWVWGHHELAGVVKKAIQFLEEDWTRVEVLFGHENKMNQPLELPWV